MAGDQYNDFVSRRHEGWNRPMPVQQKKRRKPFLVMMIIMLALFSALYAYIFLYPLLQPSPTVEKTSGSLQAVIDSYPDYNVGVSLIDTKSQDQINVGYQSAFTAASTTKILTAVITLSEVEKGRLSLDKKFSGYPVSWHLRQLVNQSNSESWKTLNHYFGQKKMEKYAKSIGLDSYNYKNNLIKPSDEAILLSKLYTGKLVNKTHTSQLLDFMQDTNEESFIPAVADTQDITVYHKYGWLESNIHDVGILKTKDTSWVVAIYTNPQNNEMDATTSREIIHSLTEVVVKGLRGEFQST